jgi:hypothetical protein
MPAPKNRTSHKHFQLDSVKIRRAKKRFALKQKLSSARWTPDAVRKGFSSGGQRVRLRENRSSALGERRLIGDECCAKRHHGDHR